MLKTGEKGYSRLWWLGWGLYAFSQTSHLEGAQGCVMVLVSLLSKSPNTCLQERRTSWWASRELTARWSTSLACVSPPQLLKAKSKPSWSNRVYDRDEEEGNGDLPPMHLPGIRSQECVLFVARPRKGREPPRPKEGCVRVLHPPSSSGVSGLPHPPIRVSSGSRPPPLTSPPVQAVVLISTSALIGFLLNGP